MSESKGRLAGQTPRTEAGRYAFELATKHPDKDAKQLAAIVAERFPKFNEGSMRALLHHYGIEVAKRVYVRDPDKKIAYRGKPAAQCKPPAKPVKQHVAVHGYSGRSRMLPGYYEL